MPADVLPWHVIVLHIHMLTGAGAADIVVPQVVMVLFPPQLGLQEVMAGVAAVGALLPAVA